MGGSTSWGVVRGWEQASIKQAAPPGFPQPEVNGVENEVKKDLAIHFL